MKSHEIPWNPMKSHEIPLKSHEIPWNPMKSHWNPMKSHEIPLKSHEIPWNPGTDWNWLMRLPMSRSAAARMWLVAVAGTPASTWARTTGTGTAGLEVGSGGGFCMACSVGNFDECFPTDFDECFPTDFDECFPTMIICPNWHNRQTWVLFVARYPRPWWDAMEGSMKPVRDEIESSPGGEWSCCWIGPAKRFQSDRMLRLSLVFRVTVNVTKKNIKKLITYFMFWCFPHQSLYT